MSVVNSSNPTTNPRLIITDTGFSQVWLGPNGAEHVTVDGMFNGWLTVANEAGTIDVRYQYTPLLDAANVVSILGLLAVFAVPLVRRLRTRGHDIRMPARRGAHRH
jgi:hypothetical protein